MSISHSQILFKLRSNICASAWRNAFHLQLWLAFTHRNHSEVQNCMLTRKSQCMRLSQTSALSRIKCCTTVEAMAHLWAGTDGNTALREVLAWEKGPRKGKADYFKEWMWAGGSKHADCTWREIYSRILAAWQSRWRWDFFITEGYIW